MIYELALELTSTIRFTPSDKEIIISEFVVMI